MYGDQCTPDCMQYVYNEYLPKHPVDRILIAARWEQGDLPRLDDTIKTLRQKGLKTFYSGQSCSTDSPLPRLFAASLQGERSTAPRSSTASTSIESWMRRWPSLLKIPGEFSTSVSFPLTLPAELLHKEYAEKDVPLQFDYGHLTEAGSTLVAERVKASHALGPYSSRCEA